MAQDRVSTVSDDLEKRISESVSIRGDGIDERALWQRLAEQYRAHGWPGSFSYAFPSTEFQEEEGLEGERDYLLYQWQHLEMAVPMELKPSTVPVVGKLLDLLKRPFHQLVVHYVNLALGRLVTGQMIQQRLIRSLEEELAQTRQALLQRLAPRDDAPPRTEES